MVYIIMTHCLNYDWITLMLNQMTLQNAMRNLAIIYL